MIEWVGKYWWTGVGLFAVLWMLAGCNCDDCEPLVAEPFVMARFINSDSLETTQDSLDVVNDALDSVQSNIVVLATEIDSLDQQINITTGLLEIDSLGLDPDSLNDVINLLTAQKLFLETINNEFLELDSALTEAQTDLEVIESSILSGLLKVDTLFDGFTGNFIFFEDSMEIFNLPLSLNDDSVQLIVVIGSAKDTLSIHYERQFFETERSQIAQRATLIDLSGSYEQLEIDCDLDTEACISNETTVTAYF